MTKLASLFIPDDICRAMVDHCVRESPLECCGVLGGNGRIVDSFYPFRNQLASETRYEADPKDVIQVVRELRARSAEFVALYHSHPRWPAIPSKTDLERNHYGDLPRIIVSLQAESPVTRAWCFATESYEEIPIERVTDTVESSGVTG